MTIAPSSTFQFSSPDQPFSVFPSNKETQPSCSEKSMGSGWRNPPPPRPPARCCEIAAPTHNTAIKIAEATSVMLLIWTLQCGEHLLRSFPGYNRNSFNEAHSRL